MMHFEGFYGFSLFGFIGLIVVVLYDLLVIYIKKRTGYYLRISLIIMSIYMIFVLLFAMSYRINISLANVGWYFPVTICITSEILVYIIKKLIKQNKGKIKGTG